MLKYLRSYIWGNDDNDLSLDEAYEILSTAANEPKEDKKIEKDEPSEDNDCLNKIGVISALENDEYRIDNLYSFKSSEKQFQVGTQVSYSVYICNGSIKVSNVEIIDEWFSGGNNERSSWFTRKLICQVVERKERKLVVTPNNISLDLNEVSTEFIPIVGDWLEIEAKVETNEDVADLFGKILEIEKIYPLRPRITQGRIKQWCQKSKTGVIDNTIFFNEFALVAGYVPAIGDSVTTEVIESNQGRCSCRSIKVLPVNAAKGSTSLVHTAPVKFEKSAENIVASDNVYIVADKLGEQQTFAITLQNTGVKELILLSVSLPSNSSQCVLSKPDSLTNIRIESNHTVTFEGVCKVKCVGTSRELVLFSFKDFNIGRWITIDLRQSVKNSTSWYEKTNSSKTQFKLSSSELIRGHRVNAAPRFIGARLPEYSVPQKLLNLVQGYSGEKGSVRLLEELRLMKPCLSMPFVFNIYEDRFHTLVHLEEIEELIAIQNYKQDRVCFIRNGEFLMLEIENLSEKRPSLVVNDKIIAKSSYDSDGKEFEGVIHKIGAKHVYVKFASMFHNNYRGEDMAVMVVTSRSCYRRCHQAIGLVVKNLGGSFLFPTRINIKKPQVVFTYDKYDKLECLEEVKHKDNICSPTLQKLLLNHHKRLVQERSASTCVNNTVPKPSTNRNRKTVDSLKQHALLSGNEVKSNSDTTKTNYNVNCETTLAESDTSSNESITKDPHNNCQRQNESRALKLEWYNKDLNYYQKEAVRNILIGEARPLPYIIFGPPGTGKTVTLVEVILQVLRFIPHARLLVATPSNSAANVLALRLIDSGVVKPGDLVRLVAYRIAIENSLPPRLVPYSATADIAREGTRKSDGELFENGIKLGMNSTSLGRHRITIGTAGAIGVLFNMAFPKSHFTHLIVDEAGQLTEPEFLIPLAFLDQSFGQVVLAGDPLQLGPIICSSAANEYGLCETYMDRMLSRFPYVRDVESFSETNGYDPRLITKLLYNYRTLPNVLSLFNNIFYEGQLIATLSPTDSPEAHLLNTLTKILPSTKSEYKKSIIFHGAKGVDSQGLDSPSWFNLDEASQIFYYVNELYGLGVKSTDIAIISPYIKQVRLIRDLLVEAEFELPKIGTVEDIQGQEFNIVLLSTVRSSANLVNQDVKCKLGFIFSPKRINVAISRAKALMIIVGNPDVLCLDVHWKNVIQYCITNESYYGCDIKSF